MPPPKRPSLRDGNDPFAISATPSPPPLEPEVARLAVRRRMRWRLYVAVIAGLFALGSGAVVWAFRDPLRYGLSLSRPPLALGRITEVGPEQIPHNAYVSLVGITEHRGLVKARARGLGLRRDFWYFRLLGGRGVFIETPADSSRFGTITEVEVSGRVVDPNQEGGYDDVIESYRDRYSPKDPPVARIIQVDLLPGNGAVSYLLLLSFFVTAAALLVYSLRLALLARRELASIADDF